MYPFRRRKKRISSLFLYFLFFILEYLHRGETAKLIPRRTEIASPHPLVSFKLVKVRNDEGIMPLSLD